MKISSLLLAAALMITATSSQAAWHGGRVTQINIGYDGSTITFVVEGWERTNCTCYAAWSNTMCLNRSRASFKEEVAMLYSARARGTVLHANIDETSCQVVALYEIGL
ncbi:MAG: hypothetical protein K0Q43_4945 [Ramlibacter sp.]|jgi:hypothetical protein|nr:hypothetical protein [Ramlibacter sp.]